MEIDRREGAARSPPTPRPGDPNSWPHWSRPVQGRRDQVAPGDAAQRFTDSVQAPGTQLVWFEASAHTPHLEEPARFRDVLLSVRAGQLAAT